MKNRQDKHKNACPTLQTCVEKYRKYVCGTDFHKTIILAERSHSKFQLFCLFFLFFLFSIINFSNLPSFSQTHNYKSKRVIMKTNQIYRKKVSGKKKFPHMSKKDSFYLLLVFIYLQYGMGWPNSKNKNSNTKSLFLLLIFRNK